MVFLLWEVGVKGTNLEEVNAKYIGFWIWLCVRGEGCGFVRIREIDIKVREGEYSSVWCCLGTRDFGIYVIETHITIIN
jgi:hypothetical protein